MPESQSAPTIQQFTVTALLYDQFDLLEVSGPLEMFGILPEHFNIQFVSQLGRPVASMQGPKLVADFSIYNSHKSDILLVPGGAGIEQAITNTLLIDWLQQQSNSANYICSVGTGAALLAQAGVLKDKAATTNKKRYRWVTGIGTDINWYPVARWVKDGRIFTSSGISAGIDLSLAVIAQLLDEETARKTAIEAEYIWVNDPSDDPFAPLHIVS